MTLEWFEDAWLPSQDIICFESSFSQFYHFLKSTSWGKNEWLRLINFKFPKGDSWVTIHECCRWLLGEPWQFLWMADDDVEIYRVFVYRGWYYSLWAFIVTVLSFLKKFLLGGRWVTWPYKFWVFLTFQWCEISKKYG